MIQEAHSDPSITPPFTWAPPSLPSFGLSSTLGGWHLGLVPALSLTLLGEPGHALPPASVHFPKVVGDILHHSLALLFRFISADTPWKDSITPIRSNRATPCSGSRTGQGRARAQSQSMLCPDSEQCPTPLQSVPLLGLPKLSTSEACPGPPALPACMGSLWGLPAPAHLSPTLPHRCCSAMPWPFSSTTRRRS